MENTNQRKFNNMDIKIYSDFYADPNYVLVGYKGKQVDAPGVIFIPYKKTEYLRAPFQENLRKVQTYIGSGAVNHGFQWNYTIFL